MSCASQMNNVKQRHKTQFALQLTSNQQTDCASMKPSMTKLARCLTLIPLCVFVRQDFMVNCAMIQGKIFTVGHSVARFIK